MTGLLRWLRDWRVGATVAATVLVAVITAWLIVAVQARHDAFTALKAQAAQAIDAREAASRRIDQLQDRIDTLERQHGHDAGQIAALRDEVETLRRQAAAAGLVEIVGPGQADRSAPTMTPESPPRAGSGRPRPSTQPEPSSTPSPSPSPTPSPSPSLCVLVVCLR